MAGKVFFSVTVSLDGFIAPEERMDDPDVQRWMAQWMELQQWIFPQRFFRENLRFAEAGSTPCTPPLPSSPPCRRPTWRGRSRASPAD